MGEAPTASCLNASSDRRNPQSASGDVVLTDDLKKSSDSVHSKQTQTRKFSLPGQLASGPCQGFALVYLGMA